MQVACYARVSTNQQQQEGTIESQRRALQHHIQHHGWFLLPEHEYLDEGISGARLDRPALDRLRDAARRGEFDAVVILSPDRLARNYAHQWFLIEEFEKTNTQVIFLQNPFGDTPQGKLLTQMQGMIAEYERAQIAERSRRGRLEKARRGEFMPWAYRCYGYRYLPKRHGCAPQVLIEPMEAEVVRALYRTLVEEQLSCRQITKWLNAANTPTPTGKNAVWQSATVRNILTNRLYAGQARYNYRRPVIPKYRKTGAHQLRSLKTGRSYRAESEWIWSDAPAIIPAELFAKAQWQLRRNAETARKRYQPGSSRYLLRTLVKCGACGLGMGGKRQVRSGKTADYLYYQCTGHAPLTVGRTTRCPAKLVRAERLDMVVWQAVVQLLQNPRVIPRLHQTWADAKQQTLSGLEAQHVPLVQRRQRLERQDQRLLDAYQAEIMTLSELQPRRQKLAAALQQIEQERRQLVHTQQQSIHWQQVIANAATFRQLLGDNLEQLSFEERQVIAQCLISKVVVTGEEVDIHFVLPFDSTPQMARQLPPESEGTPGHFYRLRLAHFQVPLITGSGAPPAALIGIGLPEFPAPIPHGFVRQQNAALGHQLFDVPVAEAKAKVEPHTMADDLRREPMALVGIGGGWCLHAVSMAYGVEAGQVSRLI
jgi:site-specific DNA recombinase